ncbi:winged helix-turn-helix domain-containing protein [Nitrosarchaeum koreense]|nr:winged helix-turn-helix domain-containing protein [Nitrosarchaeum koreense]
MMIKSLKRKTILQIVESNPGVGFIDIQKHTGYANGVLSHHLKRLENEGHIRIKHGKRKIWIFSSIVNTDNDNLLIFFRKETCQKILLFLLDVKIATFSQIRDAVEKSPSTTSVTMKMLLGEKLIRKIYGFPLKYELEDYEKTLQVIETIKPSNVDVLKDRFADTFSYY